jgi:prevent-host-death family protein
MQHPLLSQLPGRHESGAPSALNRETSASTLVAWGDLSVGAAGERLGTGGPSSATVRSNMANRAIPQRELRNNIGEILRQAEAGTEFTITVRGRPVARLGPPDQPHVRRADVDSGTILALLAETPVDDRFSADLQEVRRGEQPVDDPWQSG